MNHYEKYCRMEKPLQTYRFELLPIITVRFSPPHFWSYRRASQNASTFQYIFRKNSYAHFFGKSYILSWFGRHSLVLRNDWIVHRESYRLLRFSINNIFNNFKILFWYKKKTNSVQFLNSPVLFFFDPVHTLILCLRSHLVIILNIRIKL